MRTCKNKHCKKKFEPKGDNQIVCSVDCTIEYIVQLREKKEKENHLKIYRKNKKIKDSLKTLSQHKKELQILVNKFVQIRDRGKNCISCNRPDEGKKRDAGHFWSQGGNPSVRFDLDNIHVQCVRCNRDLHGNLLDYRPGLIKKIGRVRFEMLAHYRTQTIKFTIPEIILLKEEYKEKLRKLKL